MKSVKNLRKWHRWLGFLIVIQFLGWTISGVYFSWTSIDEVHGDLTFRHPHGFQKNATLANPDSILNLVIDKDVHGLKAMELVTVLDTLYYRIQVYNHDLTLRTRLFNASTVKERHRLTEEEAKLMAIQSFIPNSQPTHITFLDSTDAHHEYRELPLPAYRVDFEHPSETHVYVSIDRAEVMRHRNAKWRWFDWFWMLHTMDYESRDDFNNTLLRVFSMFGMITIASGFWLFFATVKRRRAV
ncbi:hypothetical protein EP331_05985 [bacterium]|nr:MAG: hypothetical protein EP331_05985 [bacterium]